MWRIRLKDGSYTSFNQPIVMGIVNLSPDSFYEPHASIDSALDTAAFTVLWAPKRRATKPPSKKVKEVFSSNSSSTEEPLDLLYSQNM